MIKILKSNKFLSLLLTIICIIIMFNPIVYTKSCLNAISVWAFKVLPVMFPFFIFTRLIVNLNTTKKNFLDKFFNKTFNTSSRSFSTFFLSALSGYPVGAKLICAMYENRQISQSEAKKMFSFCSVSGPMFMLGTIGLAMLNSFKSGIIILISNITGCLLNGLIYRGKKENLKNNINYSNSKTNILSDSIHDSLISILMVGSYIVLSFIFIDILNNLKIIPTATNLICNIFNCGDHREVINSIFNGLIEITRGILDLSRSTLSLQVKTIISSTLIGFGGISILLQSLSFLSRVNIPVKSMLLQKITQSILCFIVTLILSLTFF